LKLITLESLDAVSYSPLWHYLVLFARYNDLLVENREIFIPHLYLASQQGVTPSEMTISDENDWLSSCEETMTIC